MSHFKHDVYHYAQFTLQAHAWQHGRTTVNVINVLSDPWVSFYMLTKSALLLVAIANVSPAPEGSRTHMLSLTVTVFTFIKSPEHKFGCIGKHLCSVNHRRSRLQQIWFTDSSIFSAFSGRSCDFRTHASRTSWFIHFSCVLFVASRTTFAPRLKNRVLRWFRAGRRFLHCHIPVKHSHCIYMQTHADPCTFT